MDPLAGQPLGPALFSAPDIIRRVGLNGDSKVPEAIASTSTSAAMTSENPGNVVVPQQINNSLSSNPVEPLNIKNIDNSTSLHVNPLDIIAAAANGDDSFVTSAMTQDAIDVANVLSEAMETDPPTAMHNSPDRTIDDAEKTDVSRSIEELLKPTIDSGEHFITYSDSEKMKKSLYLETN